MICHRPLSSAADIGRCHRPPTSAAVIDRCCPGGGEDVAAEAGIRREADAEGGSEKEGGTHGTDAGPRLKARLRAGGGEGALGDHSEGERRGRGRGEGGEREEEGERELMLDRASKLVSGLAGERERWEITVKVRGGDEGGEREGRGRRRGRGEGGEREGRGRREGGEREGRGRGRGN